MKYAGFGAPSGYWAEAYLSRVRYDEQLSLAQSIIKVAGLHPVYEPAVRINHWRWSSYKLFVLRDGELPDINRSAFLRPAYSLNENWIAFDGGQRCDLPGDGAPLVEAVQRLVERVKESAS